MRITTKGQVTVPKDVRELLGISPETEIAFIKENGRAYLVKTNDAAPTGKFSKLRGIASTSMSTDEIMHLMRAG